MRRLGCLYIILLFLTGPTLVFIYQRIRHCAAAENPITSRPGHLKPFGCCTKRTPVQSVDEWPKSADFFRTYVWNRKPLLIKNGAKVSPAFELWTDDYFLNKLQIPDGATVQVEQGKKEDRNKPTKTMTLREFVRTYNTTDQYMVQDMPAYLSKDVVYPPSIQCEGVSDIHSASVLWFSSGGTKSVVHTDGYDNINCLFRGRKTLIMVDPDVHGDKVPLDRPEGSYSTVDVDKVDYTKYPALADVEFYYVNMEPGDCLFIPFLWIHQVNSFGSNLAVNVWWDHEGSKKLNLDLCKNEYDKSMTLDKYRPNEASSEAPLYSDVKSAMDFDDFVEDTVGDVDEFNNVAGTGYQDILRQIFDIMDRNKDGIIIGSEFTKLEGNDQLKVESLYKKFMAISDAVEAELKENKGWQSGPNDEL